MLMRAIALPTGAFDWRADQGSEERSRARLAAVRAIMASRGVSHAVVAGTVFDDGALSWLTGFVPKLGPAFALLSLQEQPRLLFSGGPGMRASAQKLTWLGDVVALKSLRSDLANFLPGGSQPIGLYAGSTLARRDWSALREAACGLLSIDAELDALRSRRTPEEIRAAEAGAVLLGQVFSLLEDACAGGRDRRTALLAAERRAREHGAQDFRARVGSRRFGPPEPVDEGGPLPKSGAQAAAALRFERLWLTGVATLGAAPARIRSLLAESWSELTRALSSSSVAELRRLLPPGCEARFETVGFSMSEPPVDEEAPLGLDKILSVRIAARDEGKWSATGFVALARNGARVLWASSCLSGDFDPSEWGRR